MRETHSSMIAARLTPERHAMTCGYWYTVQASGMAHTAFATRAGLDRWLAERGLSLEKPLDGAGEWCRIVGTYRTESHYHDADAFPLLNGERTRTVSNGDYVEAVITTDADGIRTVHTLNPNVRTRKVFDYRESNKLMS